MRRTIWFGATALALATAVVIPRTPLVPAARASTPEAIISLTFDDSDEDQYTNAFPLLQQYGYTGTFFVITGYIGVNSSAMTLPQLQSLYAAGNEIAGHTVLHENLTQVNTGEATREICDSRDTLLNWGFPVTGFAYPYGASTPAIENIVQQCGYNYARSDFSLQSPAGCSGCALSDTIPPSDPYSISAPQSIQDTWTLAQVESLVTQAESAGGWEPIIFHHICNDACDPYSITPANFGAFLAWLQTQPVEVENMNQVMGGSVNPAVSVPSVPPAAPGTNAVANPTLQTADPNNPGVPDCWITSDTGTNTASFAETSPGYNGSSTAETVTMSNYTSGDAKLLTRQDLGECAPSVVDGDQYTVSAWYQSTTPTQFAIYYQEPNGGWVYWTQSPAYPASSGWTQANWATPAIPAGATAVSFGLTIAANGTLTTDNYSLMDTGGPPSYPSVSLTAPASGATLSGPVTFSATASSSIGISAVNFLVDGVAVATSTSAPYTASWNSTNVGDGPVTVAAQAVDIAGDQTTSAGQPATVSNAPNQGGNMLANGLLETNTGGGSTPNCWQEGGSGTNTYTWTYNSTSGPPAGGDSETVAISSYTSGARDLVTAQNTSACSPRVTAGQTYTLGAAYQSTAPVHIQAYYLNASGSWVYWTQSPALAASSSWAQAAWTPPAVPSGATALSFGLDLAATGTLTTGDYTMTAG
jgi:peptidoglycan/xylan/chitin deacetylase (PgdA/CDA1 family)